MEATADPGHQRMSSPWGALSFASLRVTILLAGQGHVHPGKWQLLHQVHCHVCSMKILWIYFFKQERFFFSLRVFFFFCLGLLWTELALWSHSKLPALPEALCWRLRSKQQLFNNTSRTVKCAIRTKMIVPWKGGRQLSITCLMLFCASETVGSKVPPRSEQSSQPADRQRAALLPAACLSGPRN